jgi:hypothetical protein
VRHGWHAALAYVLSFALMPPMAEEVMPPGA